MGLVKAPQLPGRTDILGKRYDEVTGGVVTDYWPVR